MDRLSAANLNWRNEMEPGEEELKHLFRQLFHREEKLPLLSLQWLPTKDLFAHIFSLPGSRQDQNLSLALTLNKLYNYFQATTLHWSRLTTSESLRSGSTRNIRSPSTPENLLPSKLVDLMTRSFWWGQASRQLGSLSLILCQVVVAQLVEWLPPTQSIHGSNPTISKVVHVQGKLWKKGSEWAFLKKSGNTLT